MEIKLEDHLSQDQINVIVREEVREYIRTSLRNKVGYTQQENFERIFSNAAYHIVFEEVQNFFDSDIEKVIKEKAIDAIKKLSAHTVFRRKDVWEKEDSKAYLYLQEAFESNKHLINGIVEKKIMESCGDFIVDDIKEAINDALYSIVEEKFFTKKESNRKW